MDSANPMRAILPIALSLLLLTQAIHFVEAGHEAIEYPSFYPHEVRIFSVSNADEAAGLISGTSTSGTVKGLHLYLTPVNSSIVKALANNPKISFINEVDRLYYLVINTNKYPWNNTAFRTMLSKGLNRSELASRLGGDPVYIPILTIQSDYMYVADIAESLKAEVLKNGLERLGSESGVSKIKLLINIDEEAVVRAVVDELSRLGKVITTNRDGDDWDLKLSSILLYDVFRKGLRSINGIYVGLDSYEGYRLAAEFYGGDESPSRLRPKVNAIYETIHSGNYTGEFGRMRLVRQLVRLGLEAAEVVPLIITYRYYMFNDDWDEGIHNMAFNPLNGPYTDAFYRTVKLKLFPWNGWLLIGETSSERCRYNPFTEQSSSGCRALWSMVSDPAFLLQPYNGSWEMNRVVWYDVSQGEIKVPADAQVIDSSGRLVEAGHGKTAKSRVLYRVLLGSFHTGQGMELPDVVYGYYFIKKWADKLGAELSERARSLVATRFLNITKTPFTLTNILNITKMNLWMEVYLNYSHPDPVKVAAYLPPWSTMPWELLTLIDAVASRDNVSPESIDLVHGPWLGRLEIVLKEAKKGVYIPPVLSGLVSDEEARSRWESLDKWFSQYGHLLVTNGPYYLVSDDGAVKVLKAFRSPTYPLGVGSYDYLSIPRFSKILGLEYNTTYTRGEAVKTRVNVAVEDVQYMARGYRKELKESHMAIVYSYLTDVDGDAIWLWRAKPLSEAGLFEIYISPEITEDLKAGTYALNIVVISYYKYYSWPVAVNAMNPSYFKVLLTFRERPPHLNRLPLDLLAPITLSTILTTLLLYLLVRRERRRRLSS